MDRLLTADQYSLPKLLICIKAADRTRIWVALYVRCKVFGEYYTKKNWVNVYTVNSTLVQYLLSSQIPSHLYWKLQGVH